MKHNDMAISDYVCVILGNVLTIFFYLVGTHSMNMMTPTAQQSIGQPYRRRATTSGAEIRKHEKGYQNQNSLY